MILCASLIKFPTHLRRTGECAIQGNGEAGVSAAVFGGEGGDGVNQKARAQPKSRPCFIF